MTGRTSCKHYESGSTRELVWSKKTYFLLRSETSHVMSCLVEIASFKLWRKTSPKFRLTALQKWKEYRCYLLALICYNGGHSGGYGGFKRTKVAKDSHIFSLELTRGKGKVSRILSRERLHARPFGGEGEGMQCLLYADWEIGQKITQTMDFELKSCMDLKALGTFHALLKSAKRTTKWDSFSDFLRHNWQNQNSHFCQFRKPSLKLFMNWENWQATYEWIGETHIWMHHLSTVSSKTGTESLKPQDTWFADRFLTSMPSSRMITNPSKPTKKTSLHLKAISICLQPTKLFRKQTALAAYLCRLVDIPLK